MFQNLEATRPFRLALALRFRCIYRALTGRLAPFRWQSVPLAKGVRLGVRQTAKITLEVCKESDLLESSLNWLVATFRSQVEAQSCCLVEQVAIAQRMERWLARHLVEIHS